MEAREASFHCTALVNVCGLWPFVFHHATPLPPPAKNEKRYFEVQDELGEGRWDGVGGSWEGIIAMSENSYYGSNSLLAAGAKCWGPVRGPFVSYSWQTHI